MILFKYLLDISTGFSDLANQLPVFSMRKWYERSLKVHNLTHGPRNWELRSVGHLRLHSLHGWVIVMGTVCLIRKISGERYWIRIRWLQFAFIAKVGFVCYKHETVIARRGKARPHSTHPWTHVIDVDLFIFAVMQIWETGSKWNRLTIQKQLSPALYRHPQNVTQIKNNSPCLPGVNNLTINFHCLGKNYFHFITFICYRCLHLISQENRNKTSENASTYIFRIPISS